MTSVAATPSSKPKRGRRGSPPAHKIKKIVISTGAEGGHFRYTSHGGVTAKLLFGAKSHKIKIMSNTKQICETDIRNVSEIRLAQKALTGGGHPSVTIIADSINSELEEMSAIRDSIMKVSIMIDWDRSDLIKFMKTIKENSDNELGQWLDDKIEYTADQSNEQQENMLLSLEKMTVGARRNSSVDAGLGVVRLVRVDAFDRIIDVGTGFFVKQAGKIILVTAKHVVLGAVPPGAVIPFRIFVGVMDSTDNPPIWKYEVDRQSIIVPADDWDVAAMSLVDDVILECDPPVGWSSKDKVLRFTKADAVAVDSGKFTEAMMRIRALECRSDMDKVKIMDELLVIGFPTIVNRNIQFAPTQVGGFEKDRKWLKLNTSVLGGSSGSPALDKNNCVVCVCSCTLGTTDMYVSVDVVQDMLIKVKKE